ncbi:MAG: helix-turn-helix transcriptional regulator [Sphingomonadaceae bacterium]|nr:helix-turn-helix transcriptional regulator [Sphingomonadaceae bacterium]
MPRLRPETLRALMRAEQLTYADLAWIIGCSASHVSRMLSGEHQIPRLLTLLFQRFDWREPGQDDGERTDDADL